MAYFLQDQAVPQESQTVSVNVPINWESQSSCLGVFQVKPESQVETGHRKVYVSDACHH